MSVRLAAPYPGTQCISYLPNPEFGDSEGQVSFIEIKRSINSTRYTYVRAKDGRKRLQMRFTMTRMKALELRAFIYAYHSTRMSLTDHLGNLWVGYITTNPNELENVSAIFGTVGTGQTRASIQIEFEGIKQ
jgi:hypothetical protein